MNTLYGFLKDFLIGSHCVLCYFPGVEIVEPMFATSLTFISWCTNNSVFIVLCVRNESLTFTLNFYFCFPILEGLKNVLFLFDAYFGFLKITLSLTF